MNENEDTEHPRPRLLGLRRLCQTARKLSTLEVPSNFTITRTHYAEQLFEKTVLICLSFLKFFGLIVRGKGTQGYNRIAEL